MMEAGDGASGPQPAGLTLCNQGQQRLDTGSTLGNSAASVGHGGAVNSIADSGRRLFDV